MLKKIISLTATFALLLSMLSCGTVFAEDSSGSERQFAQSTIEGGAILHCINWSYNTIKSNLPAIKAAGYTAVQTSPVQKPKDYRSSFTNLSEHWWKFYQPLSLTIADGNTWLGTKAELKALCEDAEENYGIKVVVDIVANHVANNGSDGGGYSYVSTSVDSDLQNSDYYHSDTNWVDDESRYNMTQRHMGKPDLNTSNGAIQQKVKALLEDCVSCGVDGFRFDAAKHIELPTDSGCASNFWPTVLSGIDDSIFRYGEVLGGAGTDISNYTQYMKVTDNYTGDRVLDKVYYNAASEAADSSYEKGAGASNSILWVESHDTYLGNAGSAGIKNTSGISDEVITCAWAIIGSRAESTSLFFARPNSTMGAASTDTTWQSTAVAEVNKFKNFFDGTSEYLSSQGNSVYNERGTKGVVISKLDGAGSVSLSAHKMADGTYKDQVSGNTFTVSNGTISGTVGSTGVAVVYNPEDESEVDPLQNTYLLGAFNDWVIDNNSKMTATDSNIVSKTVTLNPGSYTFKIKKFDDWYGNNGAIDNTTVTTSSTGWQMSTSDDNCTLNATGGKYTFQFNTSTGYLKVLYAPLTARLDASAAESQGNYKWAAWTWGGTQSGKWIEPDGNEFSGLCENVIFASFEKNKTVSWGDKKAQTDNLTVDSDIFRITDTTDGKYDGSWYDGASAYETGNGEFVYLAETFTRDSADTANFSIKNEFRNIQILGVQTKKNSEKSIRFVAVIDNKIAQDADEYGFIAGASDEFDSAKEYVEGQTYLTAKHIMKCKETSNTVSGDYGDYYASTGYKYVTFAVNNIEDYSVSVRFFVKKGDNVYYATYTNKANETYDSCTVNWENIVAASGSN